MANQEHLKILKKGVQAWNQWRRENPEIWVDLYKVDLDKDTFNQAHSVGGIDLRGINFINTDLRYAQFGGWADLTNADLRGAILTYADLSHSRFRSVDFRGADLLEAKAISTSFKAATLTGACIQDWNINSRTNLQDVICEYIFIKYDHKKQQFTSRRPHDPNQIFTPGEFTKRYQIVLETVDLFFNDGIDWAAFLASLQDLKAKYGDDLNIQGIEKKAGNSFMVRLEVPSDVDKGAVERNGKEWYEVKLQMIEANYQERLQLQGEQLSFFREQVKNERIRNTWLQGMVEKVVENNSSKYDLRGAKFGGGFAADGGTQTGGTLNDLSQNIEQNINKIGSLIQSLRDKAQSLPEAQRTEAIEHLDDLETDLKQPPEKRKPSRIKSTLLALGMIATAVSGAVSGANEFATQAQELKDKVETLLQIEQVESRSQDAIDVKATDSDQP